MNTLIESVGGSRAAQPPHQVAGDGTLVRTSPRKIATRPAVITRPFTIASGVETASDR